MVETAVAPEAKTEAAAAQPVVAPEVAKAPEPAVDWEARAKALESDIAKLTKEVSDSRGREIGQLKQAERDALLQRMADRQDALAEYVTNQDLAAYQAKVREIDGRARSASVTAEVEAVKTAALIELTDIEKATGGNLEKNPLFESTLLYWRQGVSSGNPYYFEKALAEAQKTVAKIARDETAAQAKAHARALSEAKAAAKKEAEVELGKFDVTSGPDASGGSGKIADLSLDALLAKSNEPGLTGRQLREVNEALDLFIKGKKRIPA